LQSGPRIGRWDGSARQTCAVRSFRTVSSVILPVRCSASLPAGARLPRMMSHATFPCRHWSPLEAGLLHALATHAKARTPRPKEGAPGRTTPGLLGNIGGRGRTGKELTTRYCGVKAVPAGPGVSGATDVPGKTGLCGRSVPKGRPVLWSGVVGSKPGFSVSGGVAAPILFAGAVVPILFSLHSADRHHQ
jgi:hypothetical protein